MTNPFGPRGPIGPSLPAGPGIPISLKLNSNNELFRPYNIQIWICFKCITSSITFGSMMARCTSYEMEKLLFEQKSAVYVIKKKKRGNED